VSQACIVEEAPGTAIATLGDMVWETEDDETCEAGLTHRARYGALSQFSGLGLST
jgi:hypothetical protein